MALVTPTITRRGDWREGVVEVSWVLTSTDTTGVGFGGTDNPYTDLCWHAIGTWGGATAAVQGSNTDVDANYGAMTNASGGSAITWTANGAPKQSIERPLYVRPSLTTAGSGASVTVTLMCRRNRGSL